MKGEGLEPISTFYLNLSSLLTLLVIAKICAEVSGEKKKRIARSCEITAAHKLSPANLIKPPACFRPRDSSMATALFILLLLLLSVFSSMRRHFAFFSSVARP